MGEDVPVNAPDLEPILERHIKCLGLEGNETYLFALHKLEQLGFILLLVLLTGCGSSSQRTSGTQPTSPITNQLERAAAGIQTLQAWYDPRSGLYQTTGWWNSANALTALIDYAKTAGTHEYDATVATTFTAAQAGTQGHAGFLNRYYDDEGWWALAWINAYDLTGRPDYLSMAESIFNDMSGGWDDVCGGGIWWTKDRTYKNAIANELFLSVSASLSNRDSANKSAYLDWANKEWSWFSQSGMINSHNLINDGLTITTGATRTVCANNAQNSMDLQPGSHLEWPCRALEDHRQPDDGRERKHGCECCDLLALG